MPSQDSGLVVFATTVFLDVDNGPGTYAAYLWDSFKNNPNFEIMQQS